MAVYSDSSLFDLDESFPDMEVPIPEVPMEAEGKLYNQINSNHQIGSEMHNSRFISDETSSSSSSDASNVSWPGWPHGDFVPDYDGPSLSDENAENDDEETFQDIDVVDLGDDAEILDNEAVGDDLG